MHVPLPEKLRPKSLSEIFGQEHLTGEKGLVRLSIEKNKPLSLLLFGPPGCGKTTLAHAYAQAFDAHFYSLSAVASGVADLKKLIAEIEASPLFHKLTFLFIDEIHRYNKAQQDLLLPYLEKGTFVLIGATTENPSFSLNNALLSRLRVLTLKALDDESLMLLIKRYEEHFTPLPLTDEAKRSLAAMSQGDGRHLLNLVENIQHLESDTPLQIADIQAVLQKRAALFDRSGDGHYNLISALHKSIRGSDPNAALYWFARLVDAGEEPLFLARRLIRMASEDIGLADPNALLQAIAARDSYQMLGSPEGELALAQTVVYLALAPKSNALYTAYREALEEARATGQKPPPKHILNAPTPLMKKEGYGAGYLYDHETPDGFSGQEYFPEGVTKKNFYHPVAKGFEREMIKRMLYFADLRARLQENG